MKLNLHKFFSRFPNIELGDMKLRDLMLKDKELYFAMMANPLNAQFQSDEDVPKSLEEAEENIKYWGGLFYRKQSIFWTIADSKTDDLMGTIGFNNWNFHNRRAEISYDLDSKYWRKGIMTRVVNNILIFAFNTMNLYRIEARTMQDNIPSHKILEKIGFKREGIQRAYRMINNQPTDIISYSLIKKDYASFLA